MAPVNIQSSLQIFKPGRHMCAAGSALSFSEADLVATAKAYDPTKHEAPIVVGHPAADAPAYGWVKSLTFAEGALEAQPDQVDAQFSELVTAGRFKKISASFYTPDAAQNPVPGVFYLRHVGFLGAQPPAVKGLRNASFAEGEAGVIEFADWDDLQNASLWRSMREWIIAKFGADEADKAVPGGIVDSLQISAAQEDDDSELSSAAPAFNEKENTVNKEEADRILAENARLAAQVAEFTEQQRSVREREAAQARVELAQFVDGLVTAGKLLPVHKSGMVAFMSGLDAAAVVEFGEGDAKVTTPGVTWLRKFLAEQPKLVEFGEFGKKGQAGEDITDPTAIAAAAANFIESERQAGRVVNAAEAVAHISAAH